MTEQKAHPNLSRLIIDYSKELDLKERLKTSAKQHKRSLNKQVEFILEEFLKFDEMSEKERLAIKRVKREIVKGLRQLE
ncbi:hypothetical protein BGP_6113 [Beggiatoa sp. PS]|nr:hypothetical protein BGP_6113 [Beggiatoa sp. PS]